MKDVYHNLYEWRPNYQVIIYGRSACFADPNFKDSVPLPVGTPSAFRGILEQIHDKPSMKILIKEIAPLFDYQKVKIESQKYNGRVARTPDLFKPHPVGEDWNPIQGPPSNEGRHQFWVSSQLDVAFLVTYSIVLHRGAPRKDWQRHIHMFERRLPSFFIGSNKVKMGKAKDLAKLRPVTDSDVPLKELNRLINLNYPGDFFYDFALGLDATEEGLKNPRHFCAELVNGVVRVPLSIYAETLEAWNNIQEPDAYLAQWKKDRGFSNV